MLIGTWEIGIGALAHAEVGGPVAIVAAGGGGRTVDLLAPTRHSSVKGRLTAIGFSTCG
jgi:hypothetical protein